MSSENQQAGTLYIVATPIGNLKDLSPRAVDVLSRVDLVAAEDTRHSGRLLQAMAIDASMMALHEHNERDRVDLLIGRLSGGESIALISDAGTPLISDPGYVLVSEARKRGIAVSPVPGPCAIIVALSAAGLPTDRFSFEGFLPPKRGARASELEKLAAVQHTMVFYESPHRIVESLEDIEQVMGADRQIVVARELTKAFESFYSGSVGEVRAELAADPHGSRGEFVVMVRGAPAGASDPDQAEVDKLLMLLMSELPVKRAARLASELTGKAKNQLYQRALELKP